MEENNNQANEYPRYTLEPVKAKLGWHKWTPHSRLLVKIFPVLLFLIAIPLTVNLSQSSQEYNVKAESLYSPSGEAMPMGDIPGWKQVFADDFAANVSTGSFPSAVSGKWGAYPDGWKDTSKNGTYFSSKVVNIQNGILNQYFHTENGVHMVSAIQPKLPSGAKGQLYGRYAVRFRADSLAGYKTAWLLWPDSETWPRDGEIDFPEGNLDSNISAFMHKQNATSGSDQDAYSTTSTYGSWHTAITEWSPNKLTFILDGKVIGTSTNRVPNTPMHWVIQTETALDGTIPANTTAGNVQIDWVAIYEPSAITTTATPTPTQTLQLTSTPTVTKVPTFTPTPTLRPTSTPTPTLRPTSTPTPTLRPTSTPTPTQVANQSLNITTNLTNGQTLSNQALWTATLNSGIATSVNFYIDGLLKWTESYSPYRFNGDDTGMFDTRTLPNGQHLLTVKANSSLGSAVVNLYVNINNQGQGLTGTYYPNNSLTGTPIYRLDKDLNFNWNKSTPMKGIPTDNFSVRWTGYIVPKYTDLYSFYAKADDGVRVWVNNQLIIDKWSDHSLTEFSGKLSLNANQKYPIRVEYYDRYYQAALSLSWSSLSTPKMIVPQSQLFTY